MKFALRERLCEDTESYDRDPIEKYVEYLKEKGQILKIGNLLFDAEAMMRPFVCDTQLCIPGPGRNGRGRKCSSCCVGYGPRLSAKERDRIQEILPGLRKRFPNLARRIEKLGGYYHWDEDYDRLLTKDPRDFCVFLTPDTKEFGFHACMIHTYCVENELAPDLYKPSACVMFPIFILDVNDEKETLLVTMHGREVMNLGENEDNYLPVGCLKKSQSAKNPLYVEMKSTLITMFGKKAWKFLDKGLRERCAWR